MQLERDFIVIQRDPSIILDNFSSMEKKQALAVRLQGKAETAFPDGITAGETDEEGDNGEQETGDTGDFPARTEPDVRQGEINIIVVSDTDILTDLFWIRNQSYFGVELPQPIADNGNFIINSLDNLSGSNDLINLRTRGEFTRPFERVDAIRRDAELVFREREQQLQDKLQETEQKIMQLMQEQGNESNLILTPEQNKEIEKFREIRVSTRKQLREVQHELKKNIENLGTVLRIINIGLIPLLIIIIALGTGIYRVNRRKSS